jgi:hypothetical protein
MSSSIGACCPPPAGAVAPFVAVREQQLRSEDLALPLDAGEKNSLLAFLAAGGNRDDVGANIVYPDAQQRYQPLLDKLGIPDNLDAADLTNGTYQSWFHDKPLRNVIDARAERPPTADPPFAVSDDRFWWVFYLQGKAKFSKLIVFKAADRKLEDAR